MDWIYLDNNATTQPTPEVVQAMQEIHENVWANPSSIHRLGQWAGHRIALARAKVGALIHCPDRDLIFTSGGTESNNLALRGVLDRTVLGLRRHPTPRGLLVTTRTEHAAIRQPAEQLAGQGVTVVYMAVDRDGRVAPDALAEVIEKHVHDPCVALVSIQWANNETGVIQPIDRLAAVCRAGDQEKGKPRVLLHVDASQAVGKIPVDLEKTPVDLLTLSAHKFHGPKGIGALYVRSGVRLDVQIRGGPQERHRRGGTQHTAGIVGLGVAAELADSFLADRQQVERLTARRDRFEQSVIGSLLGTVVNGQGQGPSCPRLWNTSNLGFRSLASEAILLGLSERGLCASAGAACSSGSLEPSPVLLAMNVPEPTAHGSVRFSLSRYTTDNDIDQAIWIVREVVQKLAKTMPSTI